MLSTISPIYQAEPVLGCGKGFGYGSSLYSSSQGGFTPWENLESFFVSQDQKFDHGSVRVSKSKPEPSLNQGNAGMGLGLDDIDQKPFCHDETGFNHESPNQTSVLSSSSGSDDPNQNPNGSGHWYDDPNQNNERKRKRKLSNRESARRSRMRKQQHFENLRNEANRLELENQQATNRLRLMVQNVQFITSENDKLKGEYVILQRRLMELNQIWQIQQIHRNNTNHS